MLLKDNNRLSILRSDELFDQLHNLPHQRFSNQSNTQQNLYVDPFSSSGTGYSGFPDLGSNYHIGQLNGSQNNNSNLQQIYMNDSSLYRQSRPRQDTSPKDHLEAVYPSRHSSGNNLSSFRNSREEMPRMSQFLNSSSIMFKNLRPSFQNTQNHSGSQPYQNGSYPGNTQASGLMNPSGGSNKNNSSYSSNYQHQMDTNNNYNRNSNPSYDQNLIHNSQILRNHSSSIHPSQDYEELPHILNSKNYPKGSSLGQNEAAFGNNNFHENANFVGGQANLNSIQNLSQIPNLSNLSGMNSHTTNSSLNDRIIDENSTNDQRRGAPQQDLSQLNPGLQPGGFGQNAQQRLQPASLQPQH